MRVTWKAAAALHTRVHSCCAGEVETRVYINMYTFILARCSLSGLEPFFGDFSAARPRLVARLAPCDSPQP